MVGIVVVAAVLTLAGYPARARPRRGRRLPATD